MTNAGEQTGREHDSEMPENQDVAEVPDMPEIPGSSRQEVITLIFSAVMIIGLLICSILFM